MSHKLFASLIFLYNFKVYSLQSAESSSSAELYILLGIKQNKTKPTQPTIPTQNKTNSPENQYEQHNFIVFQDSSWSSSSFFFDTIYLIRNIYATTEVYDTLFTFSIIWKQCISTWRKMHPMAIHCEDTGFNQFMRALQQLEEKNETKKIKTPEISTPFDKTSDF